MQSAGNTQPTSSVVSDSLVNLETGLSGVDKFLTRAIEALKILHEKELKGIDRLQEEKAFKRLEEFKEDFARVRQEVKDYSANLPGASMRDFADQQRQKEYEKSIIGRLEQLAKEQFKKFTEMLEGQASAVKNNELLKAVFKVVTAACNAVSTIAKNTLGNMVAMGELAKSVVDLGGAVKAAAGQKPSQRQI